MNLTICKAQFFFAASLISFSVGYALEKEHNTTTSAYYQQESSIINVLEVQTGLFNSLKGITALQKHYVCLQNPTKLQDFEKHIGMQSFEANSSNLEEALDGAALVVTKKLEEYERLLVQLMNKIDTVSHNSSDSQKFESLAKTLEQRWSEFENSLTSWDAELKGSVKNGGLVALALWALPYGSIKAKAGFDTGSRVSGIRNLLLSLAIAVPSSLVIGGLLATAFKKLSSYVYEHKPEEYTSDVLHKLYKQLKIVVGLEELFNATLVYQKHRELREQRFLALGD